MGLRPRPHWGAYSAHPDLLAGFKGHSKRGGVGKTRGGRNREGGENGKLGE